GLGVDQARELVLRLLLESIVDGLGRREGEVRAPARIELVKQVEAWASQNPTVAIDLDTLAGRVYASRRSLVRGFRDHLGLGPISFLKLRRLHGVRRELLREHPEQGRVHEVAAAWGFHSAGHFARDYRRLFGESPSATLQRGAEVEPEDDMEASSVSD
ncbi:MAG: helix-turn-helix domain-containing protein, partial [Cyanobacteriota bacterium]